MTERRRPIKVVIAKAGLDGHERGAHAVATLLRDAGMETIYLGMFQTPENIVQAAIDEDVDVIGLSSLNGEHLTFTRKVVAAMEEAELDDVLLVLGGVLPIEDVPKVKDLGVDEVFRAGTRMHEIVAYLKENVRRDPSVVG